MLNVYKYLLIGALYFGISLVPFWNILYSNSLFDLKYVAIFAMVKKVVKIFLDFPAGYLIDKIGYRRILPFPIVLKVFFITFFCLFYREINNKNHLIVFSIFFVLCEACSDIVFNWKLEVGIFNSLREYNKLDLYSKFVNIYYIILNCVEAFSVLLGYKLIVFIQSGDERIVYMYVIISIILLLLIFNTKGISSLCLERKYSFTEAAKKIISFENLLSFYYAIFFGIIVSICYALRNVIIGWTGKSFYNFTLSGSLLITATLFGSVLCIILPQGLVLKLFRKIGIKVVLLVLFLNCVMCFVCKECLLFLMFILSLLYPIFQSSLEYKIDYHSNATSRNMSSSIGSTIYNIISVLCLIFVSAASNFMEMKYILFIIFFTLFLIMCYVEYKLKAYNEMV